MEMKHKLMIDFISSSRRKKEKNKGSLMAMKEEEGRKGRRGKCILSLSLF